MPATEQQYKQADAICKAVMQLRPDLPQNQSLDEWLYDHKEKLTPAEFVLAAAARAYHPDHNKDFE